MKLQIQEIIVKSLAQKYISKFSVAVQFCLISLPFSKYFVQDSGTSYVTVIMHFSIKGGLSCLKKFLATESLLKMMKNAFNFTLKAIFVLKVFKYLSRLFGHAEIRLSEKANVNYKIYDLTNWITSTYKAHIAQYLIK